MMGSDVLFVRYTIDEDTYFLEDGDCNGTFVWLR